MLVLSSLTLSPALVAKGLLLVLCSLCARFFFLLAWDVSFGLGVELSISVAEQVLELG